MYSEIKWHFLRGDVSRYRHYFAIVTYDSLPLITLKARFYLLPLFVNLSHTHSNARNIFLIYSIFKDVSQGTLVLN